MLAQVFRSAFGHDQAAALAAFGAEVDEPVGRSDDVEVVLDDHQRVAGFEQSAQAAHELGDVIEVQTGGGLVEQKQRAFARHRLATGGLAFGGFGQKAREFQALRFAARERGHGLAQTHVLQAHVHDRLQHADDLAVLCKQAGGFAHGQRQHIGHVERTAAALDLHLEHLGPVTLAVAIGATQIHVAQKLHFHVLKARAAAGRATPVAAVETELAAGVAALARHWGVGEDRSNGVPRPHVTHRVGARGFADGRLVHKDHSAQVIGAQEPVVCARRVGGLAEVPQQGRGQDVLDQTRLARARHTGDHHHALQRDVDRDVAQVVLARAFQNQTRRAVGDHALEAHAHLFAPTQVRTGQGVGVTDRSGGAVEHDFTATLAGARPHVDQTVCGEHDRRVVLHHHQGVARVAQAQHGFVDARHVARVQADAGLVEHEQGVDQGRAQGGGQVDALHLAAAEGAALAVQRQVADAHVAQIAQAGVDLVEQQTQRLLLARCAALHLGRDRGEESAQGVQRHEHEVVQAQAGQGLQLRAGPRHAFGQVTPLGRHHRIGLGLAAQAPQQAVGFEARTAATGALGVAAVLGQEHADVHLVGLALQVFKETRQAVPLLGPLAFPFRAAVDHPISLRVGQFGPRGVAGDARGLGVAHEVVLVFLPSRGLQDLDRTAAQGEFVVRDDQAVVHPNDPAKAAAGLTSPHRRVEREHRWRGFAVPQAALGAMQPGRKLPTQLRPVFGHHVHLQVAAAALERDLDGFDHPRRLGAAQAETVGHHVEHLHLGDLGRGLGARFGFGFGLVDHRSRTLFHALAVHPREAAGRQPLGDLLGAGRAGQLHRKTQHQPRLHRHGRDAFAQGLCDRVG